VVRRELETRSMRCDQEERAATGRAGDAADAALVDDLAGAQHVLAEKRLEDAWREKMSETREGEACVMRGGWNLVSLTWMGVRRRRGPRT
jgi:hypothetical protein